MACQAVGSDAFRIQTGDLLGGRCKAEDCQIENAGFLQLSHVPGYWSPHTVRYIGALWHLWALCLCQPL
jgi:hypothetical protein